MTQTLLTAFIPLGFLIVLGFAIGKILRLDLKTMALLAIYAITPIVAFGSTAQLDFKPSMLLLPLASFCMASVVAFLMLFIGKILKNDSYRYTLPMACGSGNTGYFGFPVALALFGAQGAGVYFLANLGVIIFESTIAYYYMARGNLSPREAVGKVIRLPVLYALTAGLLFASFDMTLPDFALKLWELSKGAYIFVGMMIAGVGLAASSKFTIAPGFLSLGMLGKFLLWPLCAIIFRTVDGGLFDTQTHNLLLVMSMVPVAANLPGFAVVNNGPVSDCAMLVLISTVLAIIGLPFLLPLLLSVL